MMKDWFRRFRIFITRIKIERPSLVFPQFRTTLFFLWVIALGSLVYGHIIHRDASDQVISLVLSAISWIGTVFIILLNHPLSRLKLLVWQALALVSFLLFVFALSVTYSLIFIAHTVADSLKIAWISGTLLLGCLACYTTLKAFFFPTLPEDDRYPGFLSAPLFFSLLMINYVWWIWPNLAIYLAR